MEFADLNLKGVPPLTRIRHPDDIHAIEFVDGVAEVEVPIELIDHVPIKNFERLDSPRLQAVVKSIRQNGYSSLAPIVCRVGALGNWVVMDGGHRITAARLVAREVLTNLWGQKVGDLTFILYQTPMSYSKLKSRAEAGLIGPESRPVARRIGRPAAQSGDNS
ncbi:MAG: ParB N-terminal domain-containing protein [Hyphomicrobiaceae bacterium]|nr:ParB N-terminal domain-containing protein [Hyphomicrobiaceae bacterium]